MKHTTTKKYTTIETKTTTTKKTQSEYKKPNEILTLNNKKEIRKLKSINIKNKIKNKTKSIKHLNNLNDNIASCINTNENLALGNDERLIHSLCKNDTRHTNKKGGVKNKRIQRFQCKNNNTITKRSRLKRPGKN